MFNFFRRKKYAKDDGKEPKRPPRKNEMGMIHSGNANSKTIPPANEIFQTPPGSPILKQKPITLTVKRSVPNKTTSSTTVTSGGDLDDVDDSKAGPPNNVNNVLPALSRPLRASTSAAYMGNNISKPEDNLGDWPTTTTTFADNENQTAAPNRHVSETNKYLVDTTNKHETNISNNINNIKKLPRTEKTENSNLDIKENAFLTHNTNTVQKTTITSVNDRNAESQLHETNKSEGKIEKVQKKNYNADKNNIEIGNQDLNITMSKNSDMNKITQSLTTKEKNGIEASKLTSITNLNLENENKFKGNICMTDNKFVNENIKNNSDNVDQVSTAVNKTIVNESDQPIVFIDDTIADDEKDNCSKNNEVSENISEKSFQEETNTEVSVLVKETREVICVAEKDMKKNDTKNVNDNMTFDPQSGKLWQKTCSAVNQVVEGGELLPATITEVLDDVKEYSANDTIGGTDVIVCQQKIPVNNQPCTHSEPSTDNNNMLSIRTSSTGLETFSSSPPKVTDSETEEDSSTREFLPKSDVEEKDEDNSMKMKKHVHWADSEGRTLESFEQCSSSEEDEAGEDESDDGQIDEEGDGNKNEETSSEEESSSSEDETVENPKENLIEYKRQDTWLDVIDEVPKSNASDASELLTNDDSGEEETSEEETSESEEEDENEDDKNDEEEDKGKPTAQNHDKTDSIMNNIELDSRSLIPVHELYEQIAKLQQEIMVKASGIERQRSELEAAYIESESIKQKSKQLEDELHEYKCRNTELSLRMCNAESKLLSEGDTEKLKEAEKKIVELETELAKVKQEKLKLEESIKKLERERDQEIQLIRQALDATLTEQEAMEVRYKKEFEQLRSLNSNREVQMLDDFEWKLREVERLGKKKLADTEKELTEKVKQITIKLDKAEQELAQVAHLKLCEIELKQLRTTAHEHRKNLRTVTRQLEDLQVDEKILQEEVNRLRVAVDREKAQIVALQNSHKEEITEKDRKTQFRLQVQMNQLNSEWEEKLKRELARLKSDLEKVFREEKMVAVETEQRIKDHEITNHRQIWEKKLEDVKMEISNYKKKLEDKEEQHRLEMESAQTHSDRDVLDLRRKMDKLDMQYQEKIEKLQDAHEKEILAVKQECEKKIHHCESSVHMQMGTSRTTLELVKQQMANECEMRIEQLKRLHQEQLEDQWEQMQLEKETEIKQLEEEHRKALELLEKKLEEYKKRNNDRSEVSTANTNITKLFNSFMRLFQAATPSLKKQPSKEISVNSQSKEEKQINNDFSIKEQMSSRELRLAGLEMSSSHCRSPLELELRETVEKLTKQVYEDKLEIERLREQLSEKMYPRQQTAAQKPQQSSPQQQPQHHHHRRSRKSRSGRN